MFIRLVLLPLVFVSCFSFVYAAEPAVRITEIFYDADGSDVGKEYVEVVNAGPGEIDMTTVKFSERPDSSDHFIGQGRGETVLQPGDVALIVADPDLFLQNYEFDGILLDTVQFSLLNAGSTVSLKRDGVLLHSVAYSSDRDGAQGNGDALHIDGNDSILSRRPSLGVASGITVDETNISSDAANVSESPVSDDQLRSISSDGVRLDVDPQHLFPASVAEFSVVRQNAEGGEGPLYGSWNFGDGTYLLGDAVEHSYLHPGAYIITFQEQIIQGGEIDGSERDGVSLQQEVVVRFPQVTVERLDEAFVLLRNHHSFVLDVSGWQIVSSDGSSFVFPDNSLVTAQGQVTVPFLLKPAHTVYFVTAGGGQFSGKNALVAGGTQDKDSVAADDVSYEEEEVGVEEAESFAEEDLSSDSSDARDKISDVRIIGSQNILSSGTSTLFSDADSEQGEKNGGVSKARMVVIWTLLLVTIIVIASAPLFFARNGRKEHDEV